MQRANSARSRDLSYSVQGGPLCNYGAPIIPVVKRLKVAIISTGDELKQPGEELERGEIYESNSFGLCGLVNWLGHEATRLHCVGDTIEDLRNTKPSQF